MRCTRLPGSISRQLRQLVDRAYRLSLILPFSALPNDSIGGTIGAAQFNQWRSHFGQTTGSGSSLDSASAAIPEPASIALFLLAAAVSPTISRGRLAVCG